MVPGRRRLIFSLDGGSVVGASDVVGVVGAGVVRHGTPGKPIEYDKEFLS